MRARNSAAVDPGASRRERLLQRVEPTLREPRERLRVRPLRADDGSGHHLSSRCVFCNVTLRSRCHVHVNGEEEASACNGREQHAGRAAVVCIGEALALVPRPARAREHAMRTPRCSPAAEANVAAALAAASCTTSRVGRPDRLCAPVLRSAVGPGRRRVSVSVPDIVLAYERRLELLPSLLTVTEKISRDCGWTGEEAGGTARPGR